MTKVSSAQLGRLVPGRLKPAVRHQVVRFRHRGLRPQDVLLVSYPKSGSTWLRFLLGHVLTGSAVDFDSVRAALPPIGRHTRAPRLLPGGGRFVRSHEPLHVVDGLPVRVLYLVRDGRDVAASYYFHLRREGRTGEDPCRYVDDFLAGAVDGYGPWTGHVVEAFSRAAQDPARVSIVRYEELRADTVGGVAAILAGLGVEAPRGAVAAAVDASSKQRMHALEAQSEFLRTRPSDGTPVVRPDGAPGWPDVFAACRSKLEQGLEAALAASGYLGPP